MEKLAPGFISIMKTHHDATLVGTGVDVCSSDYENEEGNPPPLHSIISLSKYILERGGGTFNSFYIVL